MWVELGSASLVGKSVVTLDITFACQPADDLGENWQVYWWDEEGMQGTQIDVQVRQAVGGHLQASADATWYFVDQADELCNGQPQTVQMTMASEGPPFKHGWAAININAAAPWYARNTVTWETYPGSDQAASTGWMAVKIGK